MRLQNKVIIVTGSTTGIGKAIALRCISEGAKVVIHGLENDLGKAVMSEAGNDHVVLHIEDITNNGAAERLVDIAVKTFGKLDAVVNNAAAVVSSNIETTDAVFLEEVLRINLVAPFALIRAALPHLSKTKGCVLNIGSVNAYIGEPKLTAYSASKGALMTLTKNSAQYLNRHRIRVNQLNVGWTLTPNENVVKLQEGKGENWIDEAVKTRPFGRLLLPRDIALAALYFASDESAAITGSVLDLEQYPVGSLPNW